MLPQSLFPLTKTIPERIVGLPCTLPCLFVVRKQHLLMHAYARLVEQPLSQNIRVKNAGFYELIEVREQKSSCLIQGNFSKTAQKCSPPELIGQTGSVALGAVDGASSTAPEASQTAEGVDASGCHNACSCIVPGGAGSGSIPVDKTGGRDRSAIARSSTPIGGLAYRELLQQEKRHRLLEHRMTLLAAEAGMAGLTFHYRHGDQHKAVTALTVEIAAAAIRIVKGAAA